MITNNSLKEYYIKIQELYDNAVNMLTAINQSLSTTSSEITVPIIKDNYIESEVRIPSFLYLENKIENLSMNFSNLFDMPKSGTAWLTNETGEYKLELIKANTAPVAPLFSTRNIFASITDNNFLKDLVSPKTFLKINIDNLPFGIESMMMKKMVIHTPDMYEALLNFGETSYQGIKELLFNYSKGTDYDEYDSIINMPCRRDKYRSSFRIIEIPEVDDLVNPWTNDSTNKLNYKIVVNTITYYDKDDSAISYSLKNGDYICLGNTTNIYKVKNVDSSKMELIIEEYIGHTTLQPYNNNVDMEFQIYNSNYAEYDYIQVPLEENQYIIIFLSSIYNNVQSTWSKGAFFDLSKILIKDAGGNYIDDEYGNHLSYLDYYNKYCTNIGDLILGLTQTAYPQVSNYNPNILKSIQNSSEVKNLVDASWDNETILQVVPINKHLTDDVTSEEIMNLHAQKNELNSQLQTNQSNIDNIYNKLLSTDFSSQVTVTQVGLQEELNEYYTERTLLQKQLNSVIDSINSKALDIKVIGQDVKYRVRGITEVTELTNWLHSIAGQKAEFISMEVEYKYKSPTKDTNSITSINNSTFTDWTRQENIERERYLTFSSNGTQGFGLQYVDYSSTNNVIKWNQIDIPINKGEDVIIRIRYKYNIGQPFISLYTPWSSELMVAFPTQFEDDVELTSILNTNSQDTIKASFSKELIDGGYEEHIHNKMISNEQTFFHLPENIYSGFNTPENNLISLKDKLIGLNNEIEKWKTLLDAEANSKFEVYLSYDDINILLSANAKNTINIYNSDHISNSFIKKEMNIVIKNTGQSRLNLYSIFPGNINTFLINTDYDYYNGMIENYDRVPIYINNSLTGQFLGQWIYFRMNNPWTKEKIYFDSSVQNNYDLSLINSFGGSNYKNFTGLRYTINPSNYLSVNNSQVLLGFKNRIGSSNFINLANTNPKWNKIIIGPDNISIPTSEYNSSTGGSDNHYNKISSEYETWFIYQKEMNNLYINKFEDICGQYTSEGKTSIGYLDENVTISEFLSTYAPENFNEESLYIGGFLYPNILSKELIMTEGGQKDSKYIEVGESLSIPIVFEYFCGNDSQNNIVKSLYFDLRNSLVADPKHYMIEVIGHNDYTASNNLYTNNITDIISDDASNL